MKTLRVLLIPVLCLVLISCADAQFYRTVKGNGNVITRDRTVSSFDGVKVSTGIDVYLSQGENESVKVEADENLHEYIETEVRDGILHVYTDKISIREAEMRRVHVTIREVRSLKTTSAGDIIGQTPFKCDDIMLEANSAGDIRLDLYADDVEINISSSGNMRLSGEANTLNADLSSAGDLEAFSFAVREADVSVSSAGDARINVTEKLVARASSAGDITYQGNPKFLDAHSSSAGGVRSR